jgi:hypothetical protein
MHDQQCDDMLMNFIHLTKGYTNSLCPSELNVLKPFFAFGFLLGYKREMQEIFPPGYACHVLFWRFQFNLTDSESKQEN